VPVPPAGRVSYVQNRKNRHERSGRESAFFDLECRMIRPVMLLIEGCSPHACKLHWVTIRSKRGPIRRLWIRRKRAQSMNVWPRSYL